MGFVSTISTQFYPRIVFHNDIYHPPLTLKPIQNNFRAYASFDPHPQLPTFKESLIQGNFLSRKGESLFLSFGTKKGVYGEDDNRAMETVLKLYSAIKERNVRGLSDVIGEECRCVSNLFSDFHPFYGKKEVLEFLQFLLEYMGKHLTFVVQPTLHDGMNIGVSWKLVWDKTYIPLGKGFSFYTCHEYHGKVRIRNMEMFIQPLLHIQPLQLKVLGVVMPILQKVGWNTEDMPILNKIRSHIKEKRPMYFILAFTIMIVTLFVIGLS